VYGFDEDQRNTLKELKRLARVPGGGGLPAMMAPRLGDPSLQSDRFARIAGPEGARCDYVLAIARSSDARLDDWLENHERQGRVLELFGPNGAGKSHALLRFAGRLWLRHFRGETWQGRKLRVVHVACLMHNPNDVLSSALMMAFHDDLEARRLIAGHFGAKQPPTLSELLRRPSELVVLLLDQVFHPGLHLSLAKMMAMVRSFSTDFSATVTCSSPCAELQDRLAMPDIRVEFFHEPMSEAEARDFLRRLPWASMRDARPTGAETVDELLEQEVAVPGFSVPHLPDTASVIAATVAMDEGDCARAASLLEAMAVSTPPAPERMVTTTVLRWLRDLSGGHPMLLALLFRVAWAARGPRGAGGGRRAAEQLEEGDGGRERR